MICCPICSKEMNDLSPHIIRTHKMSICDFRNTYPNCALMSKDRLIQISLGGKLGGDLSVERKNKRVEMYNKKPNKCLSCDKILPYELRNRKYCRDAQCIRVLYSRNKIWSKMSLETKEKIILNLKTYSDLMVTNGFSENQKKYFNSKGETELFNIIKNKFTKYHWQTGGLWNIGNNLRKQFDIYCKELNLIIEYDGVYHFHHIYDNYELVVAKDKQLEIFCNTSGWKLIRVNECTYKQYNGILDIIYSMIRNVHKIPKVTKLYFITEKR